MSNVLFPSTLPGITYPIIRTPTFSTIIQKSANGKETRSALYVSPLWKWELPFSFVSWNDATHTFFQLYGILAGQYGAWGSFRFLDDYDNNSVTTNQGSPGQFGTGDGTTTMFQIGRVMGGFLEPIYAVNTINHIYINGVGTGAYSINSSGLITFSSAPASGAALTADFTYYWRVRFLDDELDFENFVQNLYEVKKVTLMGVRDIS